ncbi:MAG: LysM peptidoglycan-binding domain-containing protein [Gammaproteobacteria bacterium]|nr:LysM peptidoglycan-binding domain-containing protein [Gammaproteobacteria bacterium]
MKRYLYLAAATSLVAATALFSTGCSQMPFGQEAEAEAAPAQPAPAPMASVQEEPMEPAQPAEPVVVTAEAEALPEPMPEQPVSPALRATHPDSYTVVDGDTLWDIAARFLEDPWIWPQIWDVNPQIANPHLIYPGDIISLIFVDGQPRLVVERPGAQPPEPGVPAPTTEPVVTSAPAQGGTVRLAPSIRVEPLGSAIPAISASSIRQFTVKPRVLTEEELNAAPYIVGNYEGRLISASGNQVYVRGLENVDESLYSIYRAGKQFSDPETGEVLGIEVIYIGDAKVISFGDPSRMVITENNRESLNGDILLPLDRGKVAHDYIPRNPAIGFEGKIISLFDAISQTGQNQTVAVNIGQRDGIEIGDMLAIFSPGGEIVDRVQGKREKIPLPDERTGMIMIVRSFDRVSYGLIMESSRPIHINDTVTNP